MPASEPGARVHWWQAILAGLLSAILMGLTYAPVSLWPLAFLAPIPLIWVAVGESRRFRSPLAPPSPSDGPRRFITRALQTGDRSLRIPLLASLGIWPLWLYEQQWVMAVSGLGYLPMSAILALFSGLFVWLLARSHALLPRVPLAISVAAFWMAVEFLRGQIAFTGYPWFLLAHPLVVIPALAAPAAVLGVYAVSFLTAGIAGGLAEFLIVRRFRPAVLSGFVAAWIALAVVGWLQPFSSSPLRVAIVQTNVPATIKVGWTVEDQVLDFERFLELTLQAAAAKPDLIVWPETMFPGMALDPHAVEQLRTHRIFAPVDPSLRPEGRVMFAEFTDRMLQFQRDLGIPMLVGCTGYDNLRVVNEDGRVRFPADAKYNSAFVLQDGRVTDRYDKLKLTPFGEIMPYIHHWSWLQDRLLDLGAAGMRFDLDHGKAAKSLPIFVRGQEVHLVTPICFEATDNAVVRRTRAKAGTTPAILINLTNDGWFGEFDPGRWHHLQASQWRAVELATPVLRAANTGISAHIGARGRLLRAGVESGGLSQVEGILVVDTQATSARTIFSHTGNAFAWLVLAAAVGMLALIWRRRVAPGSSSMR